MDRESGVIRVKRVDHIGIAVASIEEALSFYHLLGLEVTGTEELNHRGVKLAFLPAGECQLELVQPTAPDCRAARVIKERGEGVYHICLAVEDIDSAVKELAAAGVRMIDQEPRMGSRGHRIAFVHPDSAHGVLVELLAD